MAARLLDQTYPPRLVPPVIQVTANPELRGVVARGASMLPSRVMERAFKPLYGQPLNFVAFGKAVKKLDDWYQQRGILGQVGRDLDQQLIYGASLPFV